MATKKTTRKTGTNAAPAAPTKAASKANAAATKIARRALELQKNLLERQHAMFERTFEAVTGLQERQEDGINKMLERSKYVPEQAADIAELWTGTNRQARKSYKRSVDKSFSLATSWVDSLAQG